MILNEDAESAFPFAFFSGAQAAGRKSVVTVDPRGRHNHDQAARPSGLAVRKNTLAHSIAEKRRQSSFRLQPTGSSSALRRGDSRPELAAPTSFRSQRSRSRATVVSDGTCAASSSDTEDVSDCDTAAANPLHHHHQHRHNAQTELRGGRHRSSRGGGADIDGEEITVDELRRLKEVFDAAAEGGDGQLREAEFLSAFAPILGLSMSREQLRLLFLRIDASANGAVDWDEFSTFLLKSGERNDPTQLLTADGDSAVIAKDMRAPSVAATECSANSVCGYNHSEAVTSIIAHPRANRLYTGSQDGTVRVWCAQTLEFERILHNSKAWITCMMAVRNNSKLCVASVDRVVSIYDLQHGDKLYRSFIGNTTATEKYTISRLRPLLRQEIDTRNMTTTRVANTAAESLEAFRLRQDRIRLKEAVPPRVEVSILRQMDAPAMSIVAHRSVPETIFLGLSDGRVQAYDLLAPTPPDCLDAVLNMVVHSGTVTSLAWVDSLYGFCSTGADGLIYAVDVDRQKARCINARQREFHPIHDSCWIESSRLLATCGTERRVSLWSLSSQAPPIHLGGHLSNVSHVACADNDHLLFTMDVDKCIRVWDLRTLRPLQSCSDFDTYRPVDRFTAMCFDTARSTLVTACAAPVVWPMTRLLVPFPDPAYSGHQRTMLCVLYNPMFHQLVTADAEVIKIWLAESGELHSVLTVESLLLATDLKLDDDNRRRVTIVAVSTDITFRRVFVALSLSVVLAINAANGQVLKEFVPFAVETDATITSAGAALLGTAAVTECSHMVQFGAGVKKFIAAIRGMRLLVWEDDPDSGFRARTEEIVDLALSEAKHDELAALHRRHAAGSPVAHRWRSPTPLCVAGAPPAHLAVGTDAGLVIVLGSGSYEALAVLGTFEPNVSVSTITFNEARGLIFAGTSGGTICVYHLAHKDRSVQLGLQHGNGTTPLVQHVAVSESCVLVVAADDEGVVYVWDIAALCFSDIAPFSVVSASLQHPVAEARCVGAFQAHTCEIAQVSFVRDRDRGYDMLATCGADCQVRLFTTSGQLVGYCGSPTGWAPGRPLATDAALDAVPLMNPSLKRLTLRAKARNDAPAASTDDGPAVLSPSPPSASAGVMSTLSEQQSSAADEGLTTMVSFLEALARPPSCSVATPQQLRTPLLAPPTSQNPSATGTTRHVHIGGVSMIDDQRTPAHAVESSASPAPSSRLPASPPAEEKRDRENDTAAPHCARVPQSGRRRCAGGGHGGGGGGGRRNPGSDVRLEAASDFLRWRGANVAAAALVNCSYPATAPAGEAPPAGPGSEVGCAGFTPRGRRLGVQQVRLQKGRPRLMAVHDSTGDSSMMSQSHHFGGSQLDPGSFGRASPRGSLNIGAAAAAEATVKLPEIGARPPAAAVAAAGGGRQHRFPSSSHGRGDAIDTRGRTEDGNAEVASVPRPSLPPLPLRDLEVPLPSNVVASQNGTPLLPHLAPVPRGDAVHSSTPPRFASREELARLHLISSSPQSARNLAEEKYSSALATRGSKHPATARETPTAARIALWSEARQKQQRRAREPGAFDAHRAASRLCIAPLDKRITAVFKDRRRTYFDSKVGTGAL